MIQASLLAQTPIGSSMDQVRTFAEKQGWLTPPVRLDSYMTFGPGNNGTETTAFAGRVQVDPFPYRTVVIATWEFDASNRLFQIQVRRRLSRL
jgi:hypothetical protein